MSIIVSLGGFTIIAVSIFKGYGNVIANKLLEKDKAKYASELEILKTKFETELEAKKVEFEKAKSIFFRYSEHQFMLYNDLWKSLCDLKNIGEDLWESAEIKKLNGFSKQLYKTKIDVEKSALLIENNHYVILMNLLNAFAKFDLGKEQLITFRNKSFKEISNFGITDDDIKYVINLNKDIRMEYLEMIKNLSIDFKRQIRGE